ncbi:MAG: DoxX family membrane protein [Sphingobacteriales bacterium]|nr:MAG: DoxX family membrane protein [Sphingobacteriales bacterium]
MQRTILNILAIITGLLFINSGLAKFFNYMPPPTDLPEAAMRDMAAMTEISWLMPLVAVAEIVGGLLLIFRKTRALGTLVLVPVSVGILLTHLTVMPPSGLIIAVVIWVILLWIIYDNREKYLGLLR